MSRGRWKRQQAAVTVGITDVTSTVDLIGKDPYHAEEITFGLAYGNMLKAEQIHEYINRFAKENNAALLQMQPTTPGAYLFVWEMQ